MAKIIGFCKVNFFSKIILTDILQQQNTHKSKNLYKIWNVRKWSNINFREKNYLTDPYYFCQFWGNG